MKVTDEMVTAAAQALRNAARMAPELATPEFVARMALEAALDAWWNKAVREATRDSRRKCAVQ